MGKWGEGDIVEMIRGGGGASLYTASYWSLPKKVRFYLLAFCIIQLLINHVYGLLPTIVKSLDVLGDKVDEPLSALQPLPSYMRGHEKIRAFVYWVVDRRGLGGTLNVQECTGY